MASNIAPRIDLVRGRLLSQYTIKVKINWLTEAVNYFLDENPAMTDNELFNEVQEQFINASAQDASNPVIPISILQNKDIFTLNGIFVLQLLYLIDISESPYDQWRKLHNLKLDEGEENYREKAFTSKKKRVFKLHLTDGHKTTSAMEYHTISQLTTKIPPGTKLQLIGPIKVVNHILLIGPSNLRILGGDVEELLIENAYENVLLKALNKPITDTPIRDYQEDVPGVDENQRSTRVDNDQRAPVVDNIQNQRAPAVTIQARNQIVHDSMDIDDDDIDIDALMAVEEREKSKINKQQTSVIPIDDDFDDEVLAQIDFEAIEGQAARQQNVNSMEVIEINSPPRPVTTFEQHQPIVIPDDTDFLASREEQVPRKIARVGPTLKVSSSDKFYKFVTSSGDQIVTVDQYTSIKPVQKMKNCYVVYARVVSVDMNTLKVIGGQQWRLKGQISDEYSENLLAVKISSKVLEELSGKTVGEMGAMYRQVKTKPQTKDDILDVINNLQRRLLEGSRFMKVEMSFNATEPSETTITELLEDSDLLEVFQRKIREEDLSEVSL